MVHLLSRLLAETRAFHAPQTTTLPSLVRVSPTHGFTFQQCERAHRNLYVCMPSIKLTYVSNSDLARHPRRNPSRALELYACSGVGF